MIRLVNEYSEPIVLKTILLEYEGVKVAPTDAVPIELQPGQTMEKLMIFQASNRRPVPTGADLSATLSANVYQGTPEKLVQALHSLRKTFPYCREGNIVCP